MLAQWQFPSVRLAVSDRVELALFLCPISVKARSFFLSRFKTSLDTDADIKLKKRVLFEIGTGYTVLVLFQRRNCGARPSGESSEKVCCCHVTHETNVAIKVCLNRKTRWRATFSEPFEHCFHHNASAQVPKDRRYRLPVRR